MDGDQNAAEGLSIEELAQQMMGLSDESDESEDFEAEEFQGHPAWRDILNVVPEEYQSQVREQLASWDAGVSRQFQKIHDEYAPFKEFEDYDPNTLKTAAEVYNSLITNPKDTWETIGRVYGLSPNGASNDDDDDDDEEGYELPASVRRQLSKLDEHERILGTISQEMQQRQAYEEEAQEDAALEEYLEELAEEYGEFDEDYVVGLLAAGIDGEEAIARYQQLTGQYEQPQYRNMVPNVMSGSGGIPTSGSVNVSKLNNQDTQQLVAELLRLASSE